MHSWNLLSFNIDHILVFHTPPTEGRIVEGLIGGIRRVVSFIQEMFVPPLAQLSISEGDIERKG